MLYLPSGPQFQFRASDHLNTRPIVTAFGAQVTSDATTADVYGSYVEIISDTLITEDCYGLFIGAASFFVLGAIRSGTITIGKDETGGTTYVDWLTDLIVGEAAAYAASFGSVGYYFPMYIKAGTSIAAKYAGSTTSSTGRVHAVAYGRPKYPQAVRTASKFENFGATAGNGTSLTSGTTAEGAWTQVGSNPAANPWWWQFGFQVDDASMTSQLYHVDLARGDATNKRVIFENEIVCTSSAEVISKSPLVGPQYIHEATPNDLIYIRAQCSGTPDDLLQVAAYGVG